MKWNSLAIILLAVGLMLACEKTKNTDADIHSGLAAYYTFSGNTMDISGNEFHGTLIGAIPCEDRFGNENSAYKFVNWDDLIVLDSGIYQGDVITISAWIKRLGEGEDEWSAIVGGDCGTPYLAFEMGKLSFGAQCGYPIDHQFAPNLLDNQDWHHIVGIFDGEAIHLYMDNKQLVNSEVPGNAFEGSMQLGIGGSYNHWRSSENFNGMIDEVRIYNRALNENDVEELYKQESSVN